MHLHAPNMGWCLQILVETGSLPPEHRFCASSLWYAVRRYETFSCVYATSLSHSVITSPSLYPCVICYVSNLWIQYGIQHICNTSKSTVYNGILKTLFAPREAHTYPIELSVVKNCIKRACGSIAALGSGVRALSKLTDSFTCSNGKTCPGWWNVKTHRIGAKSIRIES